jgi:hypothetical protein
MSVLTNFGAPWQSRPGIADVEQGGWRPLRDDVETPKPLVEDRIERSSELTSDEKLFYRQLGRLIARLIRPYLATHNFNVQKLDRVGCMGTAPDLHCRGLELGTQRQ